MYFKGTPTRGVGEIARATKATGGYLNAHTIYDHTSYYTVVPVAGFRRRPWRSRPTRTRIRSIDAGELAKEIEVIVQEVRRKEDAPAALAGESLYALLYDQHRIRRWRMGRPDALRTFTRDQVVGVLPELLSAQQHHPQHRGRRRYRSRFTAAVEAAYGWLPDRAVDRVARAREPDRRPAIPLSRVERRHRRDAGRVRMAHGPDACIRTRRCSISPPWSWVRVAGRASIAACANAGWPRLRLRPTTRRPSSACSLCTPSAPRIGQERQPERSGPSSCSYAMRGSTGGSCCGAAAARGALGTPERVHRGPGFIFRGWQALGDASLGDRYLERALAATPHDVTDAVARYMLTDSDVAAVVYRPARTSRWRHTLSICCHTRPGPRRSPFRPLRPARGSVLAASTRRLVLEARRAACASIALRTAYRFSSVARPGGRMTHVGVVSHWWRA